MSRPVDLWYRDQPAKRALEAPARPTPTVLALPLVAPADADIPTGSVALWFDTVANVVRFRAKYPNGTLKSGTVALA